MQKLKNWLNGLSDVLPDLLIGILLYGVVCEAVGLIFVKDRLFYSIGLLTGILCAMGMAVHMAWSLNMALDLGESGAVKKMQLQIRDCRCGDICFMALRYRKSDRSLFRHHGFESSGVFTAVYS